MQVLINKIPTLAMLLPIYFLGIITLAVVGERFFYFHKRKLKRDFFARLSVFLEKGDMEEVNHFCDEENNPVSSSLKGTLLIVRRLKKKNLFPSRTDSPSGGAFEELEKPIKESIVEAYRLAGSDQISLLEKHLSILATIATVAPLLGLLGTVTGMLKSFDALSLAVASAKYAQLVAAGVSEALLTTFLGLVVAVPAYIFYNYFVNYINAVAKDMERGLFLFMDLFVWNSFSGD
jgi:biopolymer transport protein ExbB